MTSNQINYWKNEEEKRSNREQERLRQQDLDQTHQREMLNLAMKNIENVGKYGRTGAYEHNYSGSYNTPGGQGPFGNKALDTDYLDMIEGAWNALVPDLTFKL